MRRLKVFLLLILASMTVSAQKMIGNETDAQKSQRLAWWQDARFGMFIHFGIYSEAARHEWVKSNEAMTNEQYQKYFEQFNPDHFDPNKWAKEARAAGMRYAVMTTKHHDGFCLFDSKFTDYKATNTPIHKDLVREYVNAFRAQGLKVGFYYSLLDWHHPDYTMDNCHPLAKKDTSKANWARLNKGRDMAKYRQYMRNQITELLTNYGKIDVIWLDWSWDKADQEKGVGKGAKDWGSVELIKLIKKLQPQILINNRLDLKEYKDGGDFQTPEQVSSKELEPYRGKTFETCQTFSGSWGYYRDENTWKNHRKLLDLLITSVSNGGNLILNVGPTGRGEFDYRATNALDSLAYWMHANDRSIYNCTYAPDGFKVPEGTKLTYNKATKRLYIHLYDYPADGRLTLPGYQGKVKYAQFLNDASEVLAKNSGGEDLVLTLPAKKPPYNIPVIELMLQ